MNLFTIGYSYWPTAKRMDSLIASLKSAGVRLLIDTRHSPCASQITPGGTYGPHEWNLQAGPHGLAHRLAEEGIDYRWLVELGNPQKNDPAMTILRAHLASRDDQWPVNRGLTLLAEILRKTGPCALLCACADYRHCHRTVVAEAAKVLFPEMKIEIAHLPRE
jgi:uncharacterized protein (DUF488 family)